MATHPPKRILMVEDDVDIQVVAQLALEAVGGFEVTMVSSGREALAAVLRVQPDLLLLDVMLPDMDGPQTLQALRRLPGAEQLPVIFLTAKVQTHEVSRYEALGALGVIAKPFNPMTLPDLIGEIWTHKKVANGS